MYVIVYLVFLIMQELFFQSCFSGVKVGTGKMMGWNRNGGCPYVYQSCLIDSSWIYSQPNLSFLSDCNTTVNVTEGYIAIPNHQQGRCSWTINTLPGHVISIRFDRFYLKLSENCSLDYLLIKDGPSEIGQYCGYLKGELVYSNSNSVTLEYASSNSGGQYGFQIHHKSLPQPGKFSTELFRSCFM